MPHAWDCRARRTHWKQTIMYLDDHIMVCSGEQLNGRARTVSMTHCLLVGKASRRSSAAHAVAVVIAS